jgi:hypothetical protein
MAISKSVAQKLQLLLNGENIAYATFGNFKSDINTMLANGVLHEKRINKVSKNIFCSNPQRLETELKAKYGITDLGKYILSFEAEINTRAENLAFIEHEKHKNLKIFEGFLVNCQEDIFGSLNGKQIALKSEIGSFVFVNDFRNFHINPAILVVGVENFENFKFIAQQKYLFPNIKILFIWRFQNSKSIVNWLQNIENQYLHFGDFDLAGIAIYLNEFWKYVDKDKCNFFIPDIISANNFEILQKKGSSKLYDKQIEKYANLNAANCPQIAALLSAIRHYKKGLVQEFLIKI